MAPLHLLFVILLQSVAFNLATGDEEFVKQNIEIDNTTKHCEAISNDFIDYFLKTNSEYVGSSANMMAHAISENNKPTEEQVQDIKSMAKKISLCIQNEIANLLSYALNSIPEETVETGERHKRSTETPMDSSRMVMRLLKHIKSNNEFQNIAIDKMMSAQEIANKFGIDYKPDNEIVFDLAQAANEQTKETFEGANQKEQVHFVPLVDDETVVEIIDEPEYFTYNVHHDIPIEQHFGTATKNSSPVQPQYHNHYNHAHQHSPQPQQMNAHPYSHYNYQPQTIQETQMPSPPVQQHSHQHHHHHQQPYHQYQSQPVSQRPPVFYEPQMNYTPVPEIQAEIVPTTPTANALEGEPELTGEEYEETVSSKVILEKGDEPGTATVNHLMTYTLSEKAHFKNPATNALPEQMQYYFYLM